MKFLIISFSFILYSLFLLPNFNPVFSQSTTAKNEYILPYPGMLPDNPLYTIKKLRDKIILQMISDPKKQAQFYLLQADKQMNMIIPLIEKKQMELAKKTAFIAEHNMTELTFAYKTHDFKPTKDELKTYKQATIKHQEILNQAKKRGNDNERKIFEQIIEFSKTNIKELELLTTKK